MGGCRVKNQITTKEKHDMEEALKRDILWQLTSILETVQLGIKLEAHKITLEVLEERLLRDIEWYKNFFADLL